MTTAAGCGIEQRKQNWRDFYDRSKPDRHVFMVRFEEMPPDRPCPLLENIDARVDWAIERYERHAAQAEWLDDDSIPHLKVFTGTEIFAEPFGCPIHRPPDDMPCAIPLVSSAAEAGRIKVPRWQDSNLAILMEIADRLVERAGPDAILQIPDIQSPMDIAALIWDKSDFYVAIMDTPEAVRELSAKVNELLCGFMDAWFDRFGLQYVSHYPDYFMDGGITLSEDEIGIVSPPMFEEYFLPELNELARRYGGMGVHCCADSRHQWDGFAKIENFKMFNLTSRYAEEAYEFFARTCCMFNWYTGEGRPWEYVEKLPQDARIVFPVGAKTKDEALELSEKLREACAPRS